MLITKENGIQQFLLSSISIGIIENNVRVNQSALEAHGALE